MRWSDWLPNSGSAALTDGVQTLSYQALLVAVAERANWLRERAPAAVALELDNGIEWVLFDMACAEAAVPCIPIPRFFSEHQRRHALESAGVELLITEADNGIVETTPFAGAACRSLATPAATLPKGTGKITFTSGSTGRPKGVCLSVEQQLATARALLQAIAIETPVHLAVLPLATLLENIAGVYTPLLGGGTVYVPNNHSLGFVGSRLLEPGKLLQCINDFQPDSMILVPELLQLLVHAVASGWRSPQSLQFIAVGGARVAPGLLMRAADLGLPVYQGYGLSECGSVVTLNTPTEQCRGAIGRPLTHVQTALRDDELIVRGNCFLGYLDDPASWYPQEVATGDIVHEDDGYLWFEGRKSNRIISSFGRNINPEWPESELLSDGLLQQVVVLGDERPYCIAIVAAGGGAGTGIPQAWLRRVNQRLPDYAKVRQFLLLERPMTSEYGLFTDNGRPNRKAIAAFFQHAVDELYSYPQVLVQRVDIHRIAAEQKPLIAGSAGA